MRRESLQAIGLGRTIGLLFVRIVGHEYRTGARTLPLKRVLADHKIPGAHTRESVQTRTVVSSTAQHTRQCLPLRHAWFVRATFVRRARKNSPARKKIPGRGNPAGNAVPFIPGLHPLQRAFPIEPHIPNDQYAEKHEHAGQSVKRREPETLFARGEQDRPGKQKDRLHVENHEQNGHEYKTAPSKRYSSAIAKSTTALYPTPSITIGSRRPPDTTRRRPRN